MTTAFTSIIAATAVLLAGTPVAAQTTVGDWRTVAPENLLVIDTSKGRVVVELEPRAAPNHVARIRELADRGFYDGLKFHRVITGFMAQTGDPLGTGAGGSDLPDIAAELSFRRGRDAEFALVSQTAGGPRGLVGSLAVATQPDAQMIVTADMKVEAVPLFCPGVAGMARSNALDSANSQFFLMMGQNNSLNGAYTVFGRVLSGLDVVRALKAGPEQADGAVTDAPDTMARVRTAAVMPEADRPVARVMTTNGPAFARQLEATKAAGAAAPGVCDVQPPAEVTGG